MSRYRFRAAAPDGQIQVGVVSAAGPEEANTVLLARGLAPIGLRELPPARWARRRVHHRSVVATMRSIATLTSLGVPLDRALATTLALPMESELRAALEETSRLLREGRPFSVALTEAGVPLPPALLGLIRAGERGSQLGAALAALAEELEREAELRSRIHQALAYPLVLLLAGCASVAVIAGLIVPRFAELLAGLDQSLPVTTRLLLSASDVLRTYGWLLLVLLLSGGTGFAAWRRTPGGARRFSAWLLTLPLIGSIRHGFATARAASTLGTLLATGAPMLVGLEAAGDAAGDPTIAHRLEQVRGRVARGEPLARALEAEGALLAAPLQLLAVGDGTGRLAEMASRAGSLAAKEAEAKLRTLVGLIEPGLVILLGGFVAFVALALLQAVYSLRPGG